MISLSWEYVFQPHEAQWWVGIVFTIVGIGLGLVLPAYLVPRWQGIDHVASVVRIESDEDGMIRPVFQITDQEKTYPSSVWSNRTSYAVGDQVTLVTSSDASKEDWYLQNDRDMQVVVWGLRVMSVIFFLIGVVVLILTILHFPDYLVHTIGGAMGALSFGIPAIFVLPGLLLAHRYRPNILFAAGDRLGTDTWVLGGIFTALGLITTLGTIVLANYQLKNQTFGWEWSWDSDDRKK